MLCIKSSLIGQVTSVQYDLIFNSTESAYDLYLVVVDGQTKSPKHKIQFNSQVSLVVPSGSDVQILDSYMPLLDNSLAVHWNIYNKEASPSIDPLHDYISISPAINHTAYYEELAAGDKVKLFSVGIKRNKNRTNEIRLYKNGVDKIIEGSDFSNGFSLGGSDQIYSGIVNADAYTNYRE